jgi:hypothetical protein
MGGLLRSGVPGSMRDSALAFTAPGHWLPWGRLPDAVRQGGTQAHVVLGKDAFEYLAAHPTEEMWFARAMAAITSVVSAQAAQVIDTSGVSLAVDVGGGTGELVRALMHANPALRGHVTDLPQVVDAALRAAETEGFGDRFSAEAVTSSPRYQALTCTCCGPCCMTGTTRAAPASCATAGPPRSRARGCSSWRT